MLSAIGIFGAVAAGALLLHSLIFRVLRHAFGAFGQPGQLFAQAFTKNLCEPMRIVMPVAGVTIAEPLVHLHGAADSALLHGLEVALILSIGFLVVRVSYVFDDLLLQRFRTDRSDNLRARQVRTQLQVMRRVLVAVVSIVSVSVALLTFPPVRAAGAGLLASAGIVGIVAGVAARPVATNILAGIQLAISQPIRVDDVVVVDGYWGRVEQIALTYVVVRVWDMRRLVLPISYFVENTFENWTRRTADILGWVFLELDYTAPVDQIRERFLEIVAASPNWDGHVAKLQVTDCGSQTLQIRALMSARDSSISWDLQCEVREKLIRYLQRECPEALPRQRVQLLDQRTGRLSPNEMELFDEPSPTWH